MKSPKSGLGAVGHQTLSHSTMRCFWFSTLTCFLQCNLEPRADGEWLAFQKDPHWSLDPGRPPLPPLFILAITHSTVSWYPLQSASLSWVKVLPIEMKSCLQQFCGKSCANSTCEHFQHTCSTLFHSSHCNERWWESQTFSNLWQMLKYSPEMIHNHCC